MKYQFTIPGRLDGLNEYTKANRTSKYKAAKQKHDNQEWVKLCIRNKLRGVKIVKPVTLHYVWWEKDRRRDLDNISGYGHKVIQDALVACGVLKDDGQKYIVGMTDTFKVDKHYPHIEVEIEEMS